MERNHDGKVFRGKKLIITVKNPDGAEGGYKEFYVNGVKKDDNYVVASELKDMNEITLVM